MTPKRTGKSKRGSNAATEEKIQEVLRIAGSMKVLEFSKLVRELEERFGVDARIPHVVAHVHDFQPVIAESEGFWRQYLGQYLNEVEVSERLGLSSLDELNGLVERNELLAVPTAGGPAFPAFQFMGKNAINPVVAQIIGIFSEVVVTPYTTASWLRGIRLDGQSLQDWLERGGDPERVIAEARHAASLFSN